MPSWKPKGLSFPVCHCPVTPQDPLNTQGSLVGVTSWGSLCVPLHLSFFPHSSSGIRPADPGYDYGPSHGITPLPAFMLKQGTSRLYDRVIEKTHDTR